MTIRRHRRRGDRRAWALIGFSAWLYRPWLDETVAAAHAPFQLVLCEFERMLRSVAANLLLQPGRAARTVRRRCVSLERLGRERRLGQ